MNQSPKYYIEKLGMGKHPEGGWYKEVYRASEEIKKAGLPNRFSSSRSFSTVIYYLLEGKEFSSLHKIKSDEIWYYLDGSAALEITVIDKNKDLEKKILGKDIEINEELIQVVEEGCWFGSKLKNSSGWSLVACSVAPGFDFEDFELGERSQLLELFPDYKEEIIGLTR
jgi:predicted cupin superfamily sugar epimerase